MNPFAKLFLYFFFGSFAFAQTPGVSPWGKDDQRGAANRMTPAKVLEAIRVIKEGKVYSLGRVYEQDMPVYPGRSYNQRILFSLVPRGKNQLTSHVEFVAAEIGQVGTQLDGLGHIGVGDIYYNGNNRRDFATATGLTKLGIENVGVFFTRAILLDIAALKGVARLEKGYEITVTDLKETLARQNLKIDPGDTVLIHTGWGSLWGVDNKLYASGEPGLGKSAGHFLVSQQITLLGSDTWGLDAVPHPNPEEAHPVHQILIPLNGIYNLENLDTSALARDKAYEFAFIFAPLRLKGATGSPGNPIAVR